MKSQIHELNGVPFFLGAVKTVAGSMISFKSQPMSYEGALFLATSLGLDSAALYRFDLPLDLRTLARIEPPNPGALRYPPVAPRIPVPFLDREP